MWMSTCKMRYCEITALPPLLPGLLTSNHCLIPQYFPASLPPTPFLIVMHSALCDVQSYSVLYSVCMYIQEGRTALYYASWKGHMAVVHLLLKEKADVSICKKVCCNIQSFKALYSYVHVYSIHNYSYFHSSTLCGTQ